MRSAVSAVICSAVLSNYGCLFPTYDFGLPGKSVVSVSLGRSFLLVLLHGIECSSTCNQGAGSVTECIQSV